MPRKKGHHHLDTFLDWSPMSRRLAFPVDEATAAPVIKHMYHMLEPENLSHDGSLSMDQQEEQYDMVMRAKADLELILGRRISLSNQWD